MKLNKYNNFLNERRISQVSTNIEVTYAFDIHTTKHSNYRADLSTRNTGFNVKLSNKDISDFIDKFKKDIAESIVKGDIENDTNFIVRTKDLAIVLIAQVEEGQYWKLIVKTIFPQEQGNNLRVGKEQIVFDK